MDRDPLTQDEASPAERIRRALALVRILERAAAGDDPDEAEVGAALAAWIIGPSPADTIEEALGLRDRGWRRDLRYELRCQVIRAAAARFDLPAKVIASDLARYAGGPWIRERTSPSCPRARAGTAEAAWWRFLALGGNPVGEKQVRRILLADDGHEPPLPMSLRPRHAEPHRR